MSKADKIKENQEAIKTVREMIKNSAPDSLVRLLGRVVIRERLQSNRRLRKSI